MNREFRGRDDLKKVEVFNDIRKNRTGKSMWTKTGHL